MRCMAGGGMWESERQHGGAARHGGGAQPK
jgi:hypothetical protein